MTDPPDKTPSPRTVFVGTAGWSVPRDSAPAFPLEGSGLERYAARFNGVEINSTFYRSHRPQTFERWRAATPDGFRFAVKAPRAITHEARLRDCGPRLGRFFDEVAPLAEKLGPILVQLPPSLAFDRAVAEDFFEDLRRRWPGAVAVEPRHLSWFEDEPTALLATHRLARVGADPACTPAAAHPAGDPQTAYWRLHGAPRLYFSNYRAKSLASLAQAIGESPTETVWCIFDNTASGAATANALAFQALLPEDLLQRLDDQTVPEHTRSRPSGFSSGRRSVSESDHRRALMLPQELLKMPA